MHKLFDPVRNHKKGRKFLLLPFFIALFSCTNDYSKQGKVTMHNTIGKNSFIFSVNDEFVEDNANSKPDKENPKLSKAEAKLLYKLLKAKRYCLNQGEKPLFRVNSKQEKIYDATFAHLIEQNYKARPVVPRTYYGECITKEDQ